MRGRIRIGALGVVDEQHLAAASDLLHAVRETRKAAQRALQDVAGDPERQRAGGGAGRVLRIVQTAQRTDTADARDVAPRAPGSAPDGFVFDIDAVRQRVFYRDTNHAASGLLYPVGDVAGPSV